MNPNIDWISIGVSNLQKSLLFYRDGLGLPTEGIVAERPGVVSFQLKNGANLVLHEWPVFASFAGNPTEGLRPNGCIFNCYTESKEAVHRVLASALQFGGTQVGEISDQPWGYVASVKDPDGHQWVLFYSPQGKM